MRDENLAHLDLNLLVTLKALLEARSVTRAAQDIGLSQPAMSHALGRLRLALGDPVLVRSGRHMVPTPRAERLLPRVRKILQDIDLLLIEDEAFIPAEAVRAFTLVTNGFASFALLPCLHSLLAREAPGIDIRLRQLARENIRELLGDGDIDLALFTGGIHELPESLYSKKLYDDPFVCLLRADHPVLEAGLTLNAFAELDHVLVSPRGDTWGVVDHALTQMGLSRRVALVVPNFLGVPQIIEQSDLIVTVPLSMARVFTANQKLDHVPPPLTLPVGALFSLWHERVHEDGAHQWLRNAVVQAISTADNPILP